MRLGLQGSKPTPKPQATGGPPRGRLCRPQHLAPPPAPCAAPRRGGKQAPADEIWFYSQRGPYGFLNNFTTGKLGPRGSGSGGPTARAPCVQRWPPCCRPAPRGCLRY